MKWIVSIALVVFVANIIELMDAKWIRLNDLNKQRNNSQTIQKNKEEE